MEKNYKNEFGVFAERPKVAKKIYNSRPILIGLLIFFVVVTLPLWQNLGKVIKAPAPKLDTPAITQLAPKDRQCVENTAFMRASHMQLLDQWRLDVVRDGKRDYVSANGKKYNASLSNTCMDCHSNKTEFCDQFHNYVAVVPNCWGCHLDKEKKVVARAEGKK